MQQTLPTFEKQLASMQERYQAVIAKLTEIEQDESSDDQREYNTIKTGLAELAKSERDLQSYYGHITESTQKMKDGHESFNTETQNIPTDDLPALNELEQKVKQKQASMTEIQNMVNEYMTTFKNAQQTATDALAAREKQIASLQTALQQAKEVARIVEAARSRQQDFEAQYAAQIPIMRAKIQKLLEHKELLEKQRKFDEGVAFLIERFADNENKSYQEEMSEWDAIVELKDKAFKDAILPVRESKIEIKRLESIGHAYEKCKQEIQKMQGSTVEIDDLQKIQHDVNGRLDTLTEQISSLASELGENEKHYNKAEETIEKLLPRIQALREKLEESEHEAVQNGSDDGVSAPVSPRSTNSSANSMSHDGDQAFSGSEMSYDFEDKDHNNEKLLVFIDKIFALDRHKAGLITDAIQKGPDHEERWNKVWNESTNYLDSYDAITDEEKQLVRKKISNLIGIELNDIQFSKLRKHLGKDNTKSLLLNNCKIPVAADKKISEIVTEYLPLFVPCHKIDRGMAQQIIKAFITETEDRRTIAQWHQNDKTTPHFGQLNEKQLQKSLLKLNKQEFKIEKGAAEKESAESDAEASGDDTQQEAVSVANVPLQDNKPDLVLTPEDLTHLLLVMSKTSDDSVKTQCKKLWDLCNDTDIPKTNAPDAIRDRKTNLKLKFDNISKTGQQLAPNLIRTCVHKYTKSEERIIKEYLHEPNDTRTNYYNLTGDEKTTILEMLARERHASMQSPSAASAQGATVPAAAAEAGVDIKENQLNSAESGGNKRSYWDILPDILRRSPRTARSNPPAAGNNGQGPAAASTAPLQSDAGGVDDYAEIRKKYDELYAQYANQEINKKRFKALVRGIGITIDEKAVKGMIHDEIDIWIRDNNRNIWPRVSSSNFKPAFFPDACTCTNSTAEAYDPCAASHSAQPRGPNSQPNAYAAACDCEEQQKYWPSWQPDAYAPFYVPSCAPGQHMYTAAQQYYPLAPYADSPYFRM